jgi:murein DD-endopeptidase MepM/ murein hydrolase activator NlpD
MSDYKAPFRNPRINSFFGPRILDGRTNFHPGMDVISSNPTGPLNAMSSGTVVGQF